MNKRPIHGWEIRTSLSHDDPMLIEWKQQLAEQSSPAEWHDATHERNREYHVEHVLKPAEEAQKRRRQWASERRRMTVRAEEKAQRAAALESMRAAQARVDDRVWAEVHDGRILSRSATSFECRQLLETGWHVVELEEIEPYIELRGPGVNLLAAYKEER